MSDKYFIFALPGKYAGKICYGDHDYCDLVIDYFSLFVSNKQAQAICDLLNNWEDKDE